MIRSNNHQLFFFHAEFLKDHDLYDVIQSFVSCNNVTKKYFFNARAKKGHYVSIAAATIEAVIVKRQWK